MRYTVTTVTGTRDIDIVAPEGPFYLMVSGGFDSALLLHLFCRLGEDLTAVNSGRGPNAHHYGRVVSEQVSSLYPTKVCYLELPDFYTIGKFSSSRLVFGTTMNPADVGGGPIRPTDARGRPFLHVDKSHTVKLAADLGLMDSILAVSHSCTERPTPAERCGICFQCRELAWALAINQLPDPRP